MDARAGKTGKSGRGERMSPAVSFIVPCYKLAHMLEQCVRSILDQTYTDFEILVLDDCSPDDTPAVANSFNDPRVIHIRHEQNLGHLRNYNVGIQRCRGRYIWLISADDVLRSAKILERYVDVLDRNPRVGFAFCPGLALRDSGEGEVLDWSFCGNEDRIWGSEEFLCRIMASNCVVAASGMVRKECYEKVGMFPLDLPYAGDWYLWAAFALHFDVAYLSEPMVAYRLHEVSMTNTMALKRRLADNHAVPWRILAEAKRLGFRRAVKVCTEFLAANYAYCVSADVFGISHYAMTIQELEESLRQYDAVDKNTIGAIRARVHSVLADNYYQRNDPETAAKHYRLALMHKRWLPKVWVKTALLNSGAIGQMLRENMAASSSRNHI
jgi:glycosyltransferase involved in cell wall biosynthesis